MFQGKYKSALRVAFVYFLFSSIWIFSSDTLLTMVIEDIEDFRNFSFIKGIFFVLISSTIVYYLIKHEINISDKAKKDIDILANYDSLTKLYTRKKYELKLNDMHKEKKQCGVILTDINGLRVYNEAFSYKAGDDIITLYSDILKEIFPEEFIARLGGDEFVILFEDVDVDKLYTNMDELQLRVEHFSYQGLPIEISVGFAYITDINEDINELTSLAETRMNKNKLLQAHSSSNSLITSLQTTLFERSDETEQHAQRMQDMCERMGTKLGLSSAQTNDLKLLALLHDIGKIGIDDAILKKPDKLTSSEMEEMKQHPMIGFRIASTIPQLEGISYDILTHHEWVNGEGYPKKLKGGDIPLNARILSIVDAFDAMTNDRIYRKKISKDEAIEELFRFKDIQFDADLVDAFIDEFSKN